MGWGKVETVRNLLLSPRGEGEGGPDWGGRPAELWNLTNPQVWLLSPLMLQSAAGDWDVSCRPIEIEKCFSKYCVFILVCYFYKVIVVSTYRYDWRVLMCSFCEFQFDLALIPTVFGLFLLVWKEGFLREMMQRRKWMNKKTISISIPIFKNELIKHYQFPFAFLNCSFPEGRPWTLAEQIIWPSHHLEHSDSGHQ